MQPKYKGKAKKNDTRYFILKNLVYLQQNKRIINYLRFENVWMN